jgi:signal transduction histidine kinase
MHSGMFEKLAVAVSCPLVAALLQALLWPLVFPNEFMFFYAAVLVSGLYGGFIFGTFSALISGGLSIWLFFPRVKLPVSDTANEFTKLALFLLTTFFMVFLCARIRTSRASADEIARQKKDRRDLEDAIRERDKSLAVLDALFSAVPIGMAVFDRQHRYIRLNEALAKLNGVSVKDTLYKTPTEVLPEIGPVIEPYFNEVLDQGKAFVSMEMQGQTQLPHEGERSWLLSLFPVRPESQPDKKIIGIGVAVLEITEQRLLEKRLKDAIEMRDEFVSIASHELKTPLTAINLHATLLQRECNQPNPTGCTSKQINSFVDMTLNQIARIVRLVDDMLDVARIRTGNLTLNKDVINLCDTIKDTVYRHAPDLRASGYAFPHIDFSGPARGCWDRLRMEQVTTNLLNNAIKYGEGRPIKIHLECGEERVHLSIQDHGPGIHKESLDKIFDRFERGLSKKKIAGLGLGLFITRQIVELHGGRIWVESELGQGSTFHVELPRYLQEYERKLIQNAA